MDAPLGAMGLDNLPKASIGNYKGVMLCNRPNEFGQQRKVDRNTVAPFNPRVGIHEPLGWNPTTKLVARKQKAKKPIHGVLLKHKQYIKELEQKKIEERLEQRRIQQEEEKKLLEFKEKAEKQREKVRAEKDQYANDVEMEFEDQQPEPVFDKPAKLTEDNLS